MKKWILIILIVIFMADYGFRISYDGKDVKTDGDIDMVVTSKYAQLKGSMSGGGSKSVSHNSVQTVTIAHGLGYIPIVRAFIDVGQTGAYTAIPTYLISMIDQQAFWVKADATNVYIKFWQGNAFGDTYYYNYKYYIFTDKGKL
jgi:hypothetical protein